MRAYLGTIPDYAPADVPGLKLSGVAKNGPAEKAGVQGGDVIVSLGGKKVENIYDYTYAIEALKVDEEVEITVQRGDQRVKLSIVPGSRE
jgi:S1-C subfamily serine protease